MKTKEIRSIGQFKIIYFPKSYWREIIQNWTPEEMGNYLAIQAMNNVCKTMGLPLETEPGLPPYPITDLIKEKAHSRYSAMA
jgi:hypothetical protein